MPALPWSFPRGLIRHISMVVSIATGHRLAFSAGGWARRASSLRWTRVRYE